MHIEVVEARGGVASDKLKDSIVEEKLPGIQHEELDQLILHGRQANQLAVSV